MDEWQKMTNYMMVGHHEGLWTLKFAIGHVMMPFIKYCGDIVSTPSNKSYKKK